MTDSANARFGDPHNAREGHRLTRSEDEPGQRTETNGQGDGFGMPPWHSGEFGQSRSGGAPPVAPGPEVPRPASDSVRGVLESAGLLPAENADSGPFGPATSAEPPSYNPAAPTRAIPAAKSDSPESASHPRLPMREPVQQNPFGGSVGGDYASPNPHSPDSSATVGFSSAPRISTPASAEADRRQREVDPMADTAVTPMKAFEIDPEGPSGARSGDSEDITPLDTDESGGRRSAPASSVGVPTAEWPAPRPALPTRSRGDSTSTDKPAQNGGSAIESAAPTLPRRSSAVPDAEQSASAESTAPDSAEKDAARDAKLQAMMAELAELVEASEKESAQHTGAGTQSVASPAAEAETDPADSAEPEAPESADHTPEPRAGTTDSADRDSGERTHTESGTHTPPTGESPVETETAPAERGSGIGSHSRRRRAEGRNGSAIDPLTAPVNSFESTPAEPEDAAIETDSAGTESTAPQRRLSTLRDPEAARNGLSAPRAQRESAEPEQDRADSPEPGADSRARGFAASAPGADTADSETTAATPASTELDADEATPPRRARRATETAVADAA
ncbi:MAG: hypothetical protein J2P18_09105, partial [Nocardia sp.]|nr:hypothetical protein [Nocardia sp.]